MDGIFYATGDIGMARKDPDSIFDYVRDILQSGDLVFGQLEPCICSGGSPAAQCRLPMRCGVSVGAAIRNAGYDVISFATNHCMDWGREACFLKLDVVKQNKNQVVGGGGDITEARRARIVTVKNTRIGFLGYNSVIPQDYFANKERPGCAPARAITHYEQIEHDQPGTPCRIYTYPVREDMAAIMEDIDRLRPQVDILIVSFHWGIHFIPAVLADYQRDYAHAAIDHGADIILGHHPHILKPVEVYKGKTVIYSMGNFALDGPDKFDTNLLNRESHKVIAALNPDMGRKNKVMPDDSYKSLLVRAEFGGGRLGRVGFIPVRLDKDQTPHPLTHSDREFAEIVTYLREINRDQGIETKFEIEGDMVFIR